MNRSGRGAVPVVLTGFEEHAVAGADHLDRAIAALAAADPLEDVDRLADRVGMPRRSRSGGEVHARGLQARRRGRAGEVST